MKNKDFNELIKKYQIDLNALIDTDKHQAKTKKAMTRLLADLTEENKINHKLLNKDR